MICPGMLRSVPDRRRPQKGKFAERPESAERRRKGLFRAILAKKSVQSAAAQPVVELAGPGGSRLATLIIYY